VFYNTWHGHLGWTLAAATAGLVADAVDAGMRAPTPSVRGVHTGTMLGQAP
jgi:glycine/D-amino acid oxidase-like deaminating enzyme